MSKSELQDVSSLDRPLTDEEKAYLHERSRDWEIEENDRKHGGKTDFKELPLWTEVADEGKSEAPTSASASGSNSSLSDYDKDLVKEIQALSLEDLNSELKERGIAATGTKEHKQFLLVQAVSSQEK